MLIHPTLSRYACIAVEYVVWPEGWPPKWLEPTFCVNCRFSELSQEAKDEREYYGDNRKPNEYSYVCLARTTLNDPVLGLRWPDSEPVYCPEVRRSCPVACPFFEHKELT